MKANIELHIEELQLEGFPAKDAFYIKRAVEQELSRLLNQRGLPKSMTKAQEIQHIDAGDFDLRPSNNRPQRIGQQIALRLYQSFTKA